MAQLRIPLDEKRFNTGQTWKDYMAQMGDTRAKTEANYANSKLTDEERKFFAGVSGVKYVVMLAENWCGDVHRNSPLIAHIVEAMPGAELRVFLRDQNADLRDTSSTTATSPFRWSSSSTRTGTRSAAGSSARTAPPP